MTGIHREYQQLVVMDRSISSMLEKMVAMQGGISQRLKWAAGANPQVSEVLKTVESSLEHKTTVYQVRGEFDIIGKMNSDLNLKMKIGIAICYDFYMIIFF